MKMRTCNRCKIEMPATAEVFVRDASRPLGLAYECRACHSERKKGRDRRKERWANMTDAQRKKATERNARYAKTDKGRAVFLRKAYQRTDSCNLTTAEVLELISQPCYHCGTTEENIGLDRIDNRLGHDRGNVVPSCAPCNFARGDRFTFEEMKIIGAVIRKVIADRKTTAIENEGRPGTSSSPRPLQ